MRRRTWILLSISILIVGIGVALFLPGAPTGMARSYADMAAGPEEGSIFARVAVLAVGVLASVGVLIAGVRRTSH